MSKRQFNSDSFQGDRADVYGTQEDNDQRRQRQRRQKGSHKHKMSRKERWEENEEWSTPRRH